MTNAEKLSELEEDLASYKSARRLIITTGSSYTIKNGEDSRSLTNVSLADLNDLIATTEAEIAELEDAINSKRGSRAFILGGIS